MHNISGSDCPTTVSRSTTGARDVICPANSLEHRLSVVLHCKTSADLCRSAATSEDQRPTPRAIRERLFRLRNKSKPSGDAEGGDTSANDGPKSAKKTATPRKKGAAAQGATNAGVKKSVSAKKKAPVKTGTKVKVEPEEDVGGAGGDEGDDEEMGGQ